MTPDEQTIYVRLVEPNMLDVLDDGEISVPADPHVQTIKWEFAADVPPDCEFGEYGTEKSGFELIPGPYPTKWFRKSVKGADGRSVSLRVSHHTQLSDGKWIYKLRAFCGPDKEYSTLVSDGNARLLTIKDPVIVNR